ncbi:MAG: DNA replication complex GINS family protein [Candidatus Nitrosopelagicus sp.]|nr:DNA replication complex GINS family protein [Candidatus Nitrosopelagicus sp.]
MSSLTKIDANLLYTVLKNEFEDNSIQKIDSNFYQKTAEFIGNLKNQEYDGVEAKIKNAMVEMATEMASLFLKIRLEKAVLDDSDKSSLLAEEKYILDSQKEMEERKETILSRILNGKSKLLESNEQ